METQRILVTGGAGFIDTNLVTELKTRGHEVIAVISIILDMRITLELMSEIIDSLNEF
jgi:nucleoside-diphosphate-sugar epimerase